MPRTTPFSHANASARAFVGPIPARAGTKFRVEYGPVGPVSIHFT